MIGYIKFFHPEGDFLYKIEKQFCKIYFEQNQHYLSIEIESTEDLDHVDEDSLQNNFPKVILTIDDYPVDRESIEELIGNKITLNSEDENYTNLNIERDDFTTEKNVISFNQKGEDIQLIWNGVCEDFTQSTNNSIKFEIKSIITQHFEDEEE